MKNALAMLLAIVMLASVFTGVSATAAESKAQEYLSKMTTEEKISQMIMPAFRYNTDDPDNRTNLTEITEDVSSALEKHGYGGVILFGQNTAENAGTARLVYDMQKANAKAENRTQLIISIDQEGGNITRLGQGTITPGNMALGAANDLELTNKAASVIGGELAALGINADFAPDVDVNSNPANPIIGIRSFSDDAQTVARHGSEFVRALNASGVISTLKHFPGHGDTDTDSHTGLPLINKSYDELKENELVPFKACIEAGSQMIMTAHIQYPQIEKQTYKSILTGEDIYLPATLSKTIITDILRGDMGYDGVVVTDAMEMDAINSHFNKYDAAKLAIEAGVDILLMPVDTSTTDGIKSLDTYISTLAEKVTGGDISSECVDAAVLRILKLKESRGLLEPYAAADVDSIVENAVNSVGTRESHEEDWKLAEKCITLVKNDDKTLPLKKENEKTVVLVPYDDETIPMEYAVKKLKADGKLPAGTDFEALSYRKKTLDEVLPMIDGADNVIFMSEIYGISALDGDYARIADALADKVHATGGKFIVMSVSLPYDVARYQYADAIMLAYLPQSMPEDPGDKVKEMAKYGSNMPVAMYMMYSADNAPTAKLPVNIPKLDEKHALTDAVLYERGFGLTYEPEKKDISGLAVKLSKTSYTYNGKAKKPSVTVAGLTSGDFAVSYKNNTNAGTATVTVKGTGSYTGKITKTFKIAKADNTIAVKAVAKSVKYSTLRRKNVTVKALTITKNVGAVTCKKLSGNKKITVAKSGKLVVKKGLKKGTYTVRIKISAKGNTNYKEKSFNKAVKLKVR